MSIMHPAPDSYKTRPLGQEPTHGVCACMADATPRLALCGADCSDDPESWTDTLCIVCFDLLAAPCPFCGARG